MHGIDTAVAVDNPPALGISRRKVIEAKAHSIAELIGFRLKSIAFRTQAPLGLIGGNPDQNDQVWQQTIARPFRQPQQLF
jgi:hypothetical protein